MANIDWQLDRLIESPNGQTFPGVSVMEYLERADWGRKTPPKCGQH